MSVAIPPVGSSLQMAQPHEITDLSESSRLDGAPSLQLEVGEGEEVGFGDVMMQAVDDAARRGHRAGEMARDFAEGRLDDLHGTMIAQQEAGISVKLVGSIRTKLLESFQELWRIHV